MHMSLAASWHLLHLPYSSYCLLKILAWAVEKWRVVQSCIFSVLAQYVLSKPVIFFRRKGAEEAEHRNQSASG